MNLDKLLAWVKTEAEACTSKASEHNRRSDFSVITFPSWTRPGRSPKCRRRRSSFSRINR